MKHTKLILIVIFLLLVKCKSYNHINFYYQERSEAQKDDLMFEEYYYKNTPESEVRKEDEVLLVFNGEAFENSTIILNKNDTIQFKPQKNNDCLGMILWTVKKNVKKITLISNKKNQLNLKLKKNMII